MLIGTIKWFDASKGFGFIIPQGGGKDIYLSATVVQKATVDSLDTGYVVSYSLSGKGARIYAGEIALVSAPPPPTVAKVIPTRTSARSDLDAEEEFEREWGLRRA